MDHSTSSESESKSSEETKPKQEPNYWRSEKGYKRKYQFREKRNYQVSEICVLMMLLNEYFEVELLKTNIKKSKTMQIMS
jgi:hypothetical protein